MKLLAPVRAIRSRLARWGSLLYNELEVRDVLLLAGLGLLTYGAYLVYEPSAAIVSGTVLLYLGVWHR